MKKQFILLICVLSGYIGYAQQGIEGLDFLSSTYKCNFLGADNKQ